MFAPKLRKGDHIRVITPSCSLPSLPWLTDEMLKSGEKRLQKLGLSVSYGKHVREYDAFESSSVASRLEDLHAAFADPNVQMVHCIRGGFNSNQLLRHIDYDLIKKNPKILCGFSDITCLATAIYVKTGLVTYSGPNFSGFCKGEFMEYMTDNFQRCLFSEEPFQIQASPQWTDSHSEQSGIHHQGEYWVLQQGQAEGKLIGGNLCTINLLQGTEYFPDLDGSILFIEDDFESQRHHFDSHLQSLILQPGFSGVKGLVIGRFESASNMTRHVLEECIRSKPELKNLPVIANVDFGHTRPIMTFPIGGSVKVRADDQRAEMMILEH